MDARYPNLAGVARLDGEIAALQAEDRARALPPYMAPELSQWDRLELLDHNLDDLREDDESEDA